MIYGFIGPRFGRPYDSSSTGLFFTPLLGGLGFGELRFALGFSLDVYPARKLFLKMQYLISFNDPTVHYVGPEGSLFQVAVGYGVN
jgi:hypothetical protein